MFTEHEKMKPVLAMARTLDIASNPDPGAIYEVGFGGFQVWCTSNDHPDGWDDVPLSKGAFSKPCSFVAAVGWGWDGETITHLQLQTRAYDLWSRRPDMYHNYAFGYAPIYPNQQRISIDNRPEDVEWAKSKIIQLFRLAGVPCPPIWIREM